MPSTLKEAKAGAKSLGRRTSTVRSSTPSVCAAMVSSSGLADALAGSWRTANIGSPLPLAYEPGTRPALGQGVHLDRLGQVRTGLPAGGKEIRTLGPSRGQNAVGARLPETLGCAAAIPRGTVAAVGDEFDCACQYLAADLRHRAQPCPGCAGNFRSCHLISGSAVSALLEGFQRR